MSLSRRRFIAGTTALAAAWGLSREVLGSALAAPLRASDAPTTLLQTIKLSSQAVRGTYRTLLAGAGEDFIPRYDLLGRTAEGTRASARRSLYYLAHLSDIHVIDAQTPARMDAIQSIAPELLTDACRPQDTLTVHVLASMVDSVAAAQTSSVTGAPLATAISTGDSADNLSLCRAGVRRPGSHAVPAHGRCRWSAQSAGGELPDDRCAVGPVAHHRHPHGRCAAHRLAIRCAGRLLHHRRPGILPRVVGARLHRHVVPQRVGADLSECESPLSRAYSSRCARSGANAGRHTATYSAPSVVV